MLWRPDAFVRQPFSAVKSEFLRPFERNWQENALVMTNAADALNAVQSILKNVAVNVKILDDRPFDKLNNSSPKRKREVDSSGTESE